MYGGKCGPLATNISRDELWLLLYRLRRQIDFLMLWTCYPISAQVLLFQFPASTPPKPLGETPGEKSSSLTFTLCLFSPYNHAHVDTACPMSSFGVNKSIYIALLNAFVSRFSCASFSFIRFGNRRVAPEVMLSTGISSRFRFETWYSLDMLYQSRVLLFPSPSALSGSDDWVWAKSTSAASAHLQAVFKTNHG